MAHDVFISYSIKNKTIADAVCAKLEENKIRVWIAPRDIPSGSNFAKSIIEAINSCKVFVLIWSSHTNASEHILNEINQAFDKGRTIIPFRIQDIQPTDEMRYYLGRTHWLDAIDPPLEKHIVTLRDNILVNLGRELPKAKPEALPEEMPASIEKKTKEQQKNITRIVSGIAVTAIVITAGWFGWSSLKEKDRDIAAVEEETPTPEWTRMPTPAVTPIATRVWEKDGMEMVYVPAGEFIMGSNQGKRDEQPLHPVNLDAFWIDRTEVTNNQFARFLTEKGNQIEGGRNWQNSQSSYAHISQSGNIWQADEGYGDHPVVEVTWYGAQAYCQWVGRELPTEAQWEKAARGDDGRTFPWGEDIHCGLANYWACDNFRSPSPVGSYEQDISPYGAQDMAGNALEWVRDWYDNDYFSDSPHKNPENLKVSDYKLLRGGYLKSLGRFTSFPNGFMTVKPSSNYGFRCAVDVE